MSADLRCRVAAADPGRLLTHHTAGDLVTQATQLLDRVQAAPAPGRRHPDRRLAVAGLVVVLAGGLVAHHVTSPEGASARAGLVLAAASGAITEPAPLPHQWWRVQSGIVRPDGSVQPVGTTYVSVDGSRPMIMDGRPGPDGVRSIGIADNARSGTWQVPNPAFLAGLPRDVPTLRARLYADTWGRGRSPDGEVMVYVADLLRFGTVPPDLRRALYAVLVTVPGVDVVAEDVTIAGRRGTVLGHPDGQQLLLEPASGALLAHRDNVGQPWATGEQPWSTITVTVVDRVPADVLEVLVTLHCQSMDGGVVCFER